MGRILCLLAGLVMIFSSSLNAGEIERIREKGEIAVSLNKGYPPFCMEVKGELTGIDVDLALLMAKYLGVKARFILPGNYEEHIPTLLSGKSDIIIAAMTVNPERGLRVSFTEPYFEISQAALVRREKVKQNEDSYFDLVEIKGVRVGVKEKTTVEAFARELFSPGAIRTYADHQAAVNALLKGEVDATVHDSPFVMQWTASHPGLSLRIKPLLAPVTKEYYGFAIRKGDPEFLNWLNLFIRQVESDGTLDLLKYRYFEELPRLTRDRSGSGGMTRVQLMKSRYLELKRERLDAMRKIETPSGGFPK